LLHVLLGQMRMAGFAHDKGTWPFAGLQVGYADHGTVGDGVERQ
jgi:hypothetical protein